MATGSIPMKEFNFDRFYLGDLALHSCIFHHCVITMELSAFFVYILSSCGRKFKTETKIRIINIYHYR